jgi:hypothetical protein
METSRLRFYSTERASDDWDRKREFIKGSEFLRTKYLVEDEEEHVEVPLTLFKEAKDEFDLVQ